MTGIDWNVPFRTARFLVCDVIVSGQGDDLLLVLVEHHALPGEASLSVGSATIEHLKLVGESSSSRKWLVYWSFVAAFKSSSESFNFTVPAIPGPPGHCFRGDQSPWLSELKVGGLLDDLRPGCQHFVILTDHKTIEVVSTHEPRVQEVSDEEFDPLEWLKSPRQGNA